MYASDTRVRLAPSTLGLGGMLSLLGGLYATQGLLGGLVHEAMPVLLRAQGVGLDVIGLLSLLFLPSAIKFLWAPAMDRAAQGSAHRRLQWARALQCALLVGVLALSLLPLQSQWGAVIVLLLGLMLLSVTQDIATDGMAVQMLAADQRRWGNTMQIGGSYSGYILGGGMLVVVVNATDWRSGMLYLSALLLLFTAPTLWASRRGLQGGVIAVANDAAPSLKAAWRRPGMRWGMATVIACQASTRWFTAIMLTYLLDRGMPLGSVGLLSGAGLALAGVAGAVLGGWLLKRLGRRPLLQICLGLYLAIQLGYVAIEASGLRSSTVLAAIFLLFCTTMALGFVVLYTAMMDWCSPQQPGTDFSLLQCSDALCAIVFGLSAGAFTHHLGYSWSFAVCAALALLGLVLAPRWYARTPQVSGNSL
ncbi:MFS transporter [Comamonas piscis]|uniref:MFS transporter n=1 Tax=Comamonas piscis TaxID=1562974 RepID=A0A7G5EKA3_9BURK|nr:MFS transporter [Comamonas piscis]QMV74428.1 MFS transporter [Comamonas piscis]WSO32883.1 MFS transporter [Comamonas piscis]